MTKTLITAFSLLVLTGCVSKQPETPNIVSKQNECSRLNTLLDAQASGFKKLKAHKVNNDFIKQWQANTHFLGSSCTITQDDAKKTSYQCTKHTDHQNLASRLHIKTIDKVRQCLTSQQWHESTKESDSFISSNFVLDDKHPVITLFTSKLATGYTTRFEIAQALGN